jgi:hypothetical protein
LKARRLNALFVFALQGEKLSLIEAVHHLKLYAPTSVESSAGGA